MPKGLGRLLFSFGTRIPRATFWRALLWLGAAFILLFVELGLRRGSPGEHPFGRDPLEDIHDYLTVA